MSFVESYKTIEFEFISDKKKIYILRKDYIYKSLFYVISYCCVCSYLPETTSSTMASEKNDINISQNGKRKWNLYQIESDLFVVK